MASLKIWQLFSLTFFVSCIATVPNSGERIVGGYVADIKSIPFIVSLQSAHHFCGGSLIAKRFVLTAAHCTVGRNATNPDFQVRLASNYSTREGLLVAAIQFFQHDEFNTTTYNFDFSIVKLEDYEESSLPFQIQYAQPPGEQNIEEGTELIIAGWGRTKSFFESSSILRALKVPLISREVCVKAYKNLTITNVMFCAGYFDGKKDACQGDSGGPIFRGSTIWGVISWGYGCAKEHYPGVYAQITSVEEWIVSIIEENESY